jgi:acyl-homoserine lactone synthase
MLLMLSGRNARQYKDVMEAAWRLRHRVFVEKMGWKAVAKPDGREIDQFDTDEAIHFVGWEKGKAYGYCRLLPTTKPHLLSDVYPEILAGEPVPRGPGVYEWTRFAVAPEKRDGVSGMDQTTRLLFTGVAEACLDQGIDELTVEADPIWLTRFIELGWRPEPLALPTTYDGRPIVPFKCRVTPATLSTCRQLLGVGGRVVTNLDDEEVRIPVPPAEAPALRVERRH